MQQAQLYERHVSPAGKISYRLHQPRKEQVTEFELDNKQVATLAGTLGTCILMGLERHLPSHALLARKNRAVEESLQSLAAVAGTDLDQKLIDAGIGAWSAAVEQLGKELSTC